MSVFGSAKTNFSSEMSLGSSALMTAASTFSTYSDADYETSSEILTPRTEEAIDNSQLSRCPSSIVNSTDCNYVASSQSSTVLFDKFTAQFDDEKYTMTVKSDTCLSQHSKIISEFMNDILRTQEQFVAEPNLTLTNDEDSAESSKTEFYPATSARESSTDKLELNFHKSLISINKNIEGVKSESSIQQKSLIHVETVPRLSARETEKCDGNNLCSTFSETKNKIMGNLAQLTRSKLFLKTSSQYRNPINKDDDTSIESTTKFIDKSQGEPLSKNSSTSVPKSVQVSSRKSIRSNGVESILRINDELQPLNIMLSKLLAEFRAMNLRGKIGSVNTNTYDLSYPDSKGKFVLPKIENFKHENLFSHSKFLQNNETLKREEKTFKEFSLYKENLGNYLSRENQGNLNDNNKESFCSSKFDQQITQAMAKESTQSKLKSLEKRDLYMRCCGRPKKNVQSIIKKRSSYLDRCVGRSLQKVKTHLDDYDDFGRKILGEFNRTNTQYNHEDTDDKNQMVLRDNEEDKNNEIESEKLQYLNDEETDENNVEFSCCGLISLTENRAVLVLPQVSMDISCGDSISNYSNEDSMKICKRKLDSQGDYEKDKEILVDNDEKCSLIDNDLEAGGGEIGIRTKPEYFL